MSDSLPAGLLHLFRAAFEVGDDGRNAIGLLRGPHLESRGVPIAETAPGRRMTQSAASWFDAFDQPVEYGDDHP